MKRWYLYVFGLALAIAGIVVLSHLLRELILAREEARQAEERTTWVTDSVGTLVREAYREIDAAQRRIRGLTIDVVETSKKLNLKRIKVNKGFDQLEEIIPEEHLTLVQQLRADVEAGRALAVLVIRTQQGIIGDQASIIERQAGIIRADSALNTALRDEIVTLKKVGNMSFKFNIGSTVITAGVAAALTATLIAVSGS